MKDMLCTLSQHLRILEQPSLEQTTLLEHTSWSKRVPPAFSSLWFRYHFSYLLTLPALRGSPWAPVSREAADREQVAAVAKGLRRFGASGAPGGLGVAGCG